MNYGIRTTRDYLVSQITRTALLMTSLKIITHSRLLFHHLFRYGNLHNKDKTVVRPSYLYNGNPIHVLVRRHSYIETTPSSLSLFSLEHWCYWTEGISYVNLHNTCTHTHTYIYIYIYIWYTDDISMDVEYGDNSSYQNSKSSQAGFLKFKHLNPSFSISQNRYSKYILDMHADKCLVVGKRRQ